MFIWLTVMNMLNCHKYQLPVVIELLHPALGIWPQATVLGHHQTSQTSTKHKTFYPKKKLNK